MTTAIQIFKNEKFGEIRTLADEANEPLFCASDLCKALGYANPRDAVAKHVDEGDVAKRDTPTTSGVQSMTFVNESGLYALIFGSKLDSAKVFKKWVTSEVLPTLRKTGSYSLSMPQTFSQALYLAAQQQEQIEKQQKQLSAQGTQIAEMSEAITEMLPKVSYYDKILDSKELVTTTQIAADYGMSAQAMNNKLREMGIQRKVNGQWILRPPYISRGYAHSKPVEIQHSNGTIETKMNTQWRQSGRLFIYTELKKKGILPLIER